MATKKDEKPAVVLAAVLRDCVFGKAGAVVELAASDAATGADQGMLDLNPAAIKAAKASE